MICVIIHPSRSGKLAEMYALMEAVDALAEATRQACTQEFHQADGEEDMSEDEDHSARWCSGSCDLPALPQHQIPWYTSGFQ